MKSFTFRGRIEHETPLAVLIRPCDHRLPQQAAAWFPLSQIKAVGWGWSDVITFAIPYWLATAKGFGRRT